MIRESNTFSLMLSAKSTAPMRYANVLVRRKSMTVAFSMCFKGVSSFDGIHVVRLFFELKLPY